MLKYPHIFTALIANIQPEQLLLKLTMIVPPHAASGGCMMGETEGDCVAWRQGLQQTKLWQLQGFEEKTQVDPQVVWPKHNDGRRH